MLESTVVRHVMIPSRWNFAIARAIFFVLENDYKCWLRRVHTVHWLLLSDRPYIYIAVTTFVHCLWWNVNQLLHRKSQHNRKHVLRQAESSQIHKLRFLFKVSAITNEGKCESKASKKRTAKDDCKWWRHRVVRAATTVRSPARLD